MKNEAIKILLPEKLQSMGKALRLAGFGPQVDEFVISMNRAAEKAVPLAKPIFHEAVAAMSFDDAKKILNGEDTATTGFSQGKTREQLATAFKPEVQKTMSQGGVTAQYNQLVSHYTTLPFVKGPVFVVDDYVVGKSLDGPFSPWPKRSRKYAPILGHASPIYSRKSLEGNDSPLLTKRHDVLSNNEPTDCRISPR